MQARVEFFTKRLVNETLPFDPREVVESGRNHRHFIVCLAARACAGMAGMLGGVIRQHKVNWRKRLTQLRFHALCARKMHFVVCQFLVRLRLGAHNRTL
jgi:hypothetical protein